MQRKASNEKTEVKDTTEPKEKQQSLTTLTIEISTKLLKDYSEQLEMEKRGSLAAFFADPIVALEGDQISITVGSKMVENEIMAEQHKLISYFAGQGYKLGGIHCIVNAKAVSEYKIFTPKQQFEAMVKEIPILEDFANRFNLEFE